MIIGIDLGTTNSLVGYFDDKEGIPKIIPNRLGKNLTPSVVSMDENERIYVGETAKERLLLFPEQSASVFKRTMGSDQKYKLGSKEFTAEELSSFVLRSLKEDAEVFLGQPVEEAIISVPAYFDDARRKATKRAGELAGLKVERIISEPTAAAIAYGLYHEDQSSKFLVFDLGGGTFDVSVLELFHNILEVRAVAGDNYLGGEDFSEVLEKIFCKKTGTLMESLDTKTRHHMREQVEKCKCSFYDGPKGKISCNINGQLTECTVDIKEYEEASKPLFEKIRLPIKRSISDANISLAEINKVVLIGGATKLPLVRDFVSKLFKRFPAFNINPDEAVCLGAAIQGAMKERNQAIKEVILTDVCPYTLGTEVVELRNGNRMESGHFYPIIERNTVIPASRTERLYTVHENQNKIRVNILQGESRFAKNNISLGELTVDVPTGKAGEQAIDVTYTYDINSILEVSVKVISTDKVVKHIIKGRNVDMTDEEIQERIEELSYLKIHPRDQEENKLLLLKGERLYEESIGIMRITIERELEKFEDALTSHDNARISAARTVFKTFLDEIQEIMND